MLRFRCDHVANTRSVTAYRNRASPPLAGSPTRQRLTALHSRSPPQRTYGLLQTRPHGSLAAQPAALKPPGQFRAAPLPHRCRVPPVRAPGQDFHLRSQHPYPAHQALRAARLAALGPVGPPLTAELRSAGSQLRLRGTRNLHRSRRFPMVRVGAWCRGRTCCGRSKRSRPLPARGSRSAQRRVVLRSFNRRAGGCSPGSRSPLRSALRFHRWAFTVQKRC